MYFLASGQCSDSSLPSADSSWIRVRRFHWYYQAAMTSRFPFRVLWFPLVRDTPCRAIAASRRSHAFVELLWSPGLIREFMGRGGTSQVSVRPQLSVRTCCYDPGRITVPDHIRKGDVVPQLKDTGNSDSVKISRLNNRAFRLAVYASQRRFRRQMISHPLTITRPHAKLASGGGQPYRVGSSHKVSERCCTC
jgi:hypothetical protein